MLSASTPGTDAIFSQVSFVAKLKCWIMVFNIGVFKEVTGEAEPTQSGIYIAYALDGLHWSQPTRLVGIRSFPAAGKETRLASDLAPIDRRGPLGRGLALLRVSESWGFQAPHKTHYLVGQPIRFRVTDD